MATLNTNKQQTRKEKRMINLDSVSNVENVESKIFVIQMLLYTGQRLYYKGMGASFKPIFISQKSSAKKVNGCYMGWFMDLLNRTMIRDGSYAGDFMLSYVIANNDKKDKYSTDYPLDFDTKDEISDSDFLDNAPVKYYVEYELSPLGDKDIVLTPDSVLSADEKRINEFNEYNNMRHYMVDLRNDFYFYPTDNQLGIQTGSLEVTAYIGMPTNVVRKGKKRTIEYTPRENIKLKVEMDDGKLTKTVFNTYKSRSKLLRSMCNDD